MTGKFAPLSSADITRLIAENPLAWIVSTDFQATPLPLIAETGEDGSVTSLLGHIPLAHPQCAYLRNHPRALILFNGPDGYISPQLVSTQDWGPTWNYAVARFETKIEFVPEETDAALEKLADHLEQGAWTTDQMGERYDMLANQIIAFRAHVRAGHPTFKLGQDEQPETFEEITQGLGDTPLSRWMRKQVGS